MYKVISQSRWGGAGRSFNRSTEEVGNHSKATLVSQQSLSDNLCDTSLRQSGIKNTGNTCYLNSTLQLLRVLSSNSHSCFSLGLKAILAKLDANTLTYGDIQDFYNAHLQGGSSLHTQQDVTEILGRLLQDVALMSIQSKVVPQEGAYVGTASTRIELQSMICVPIVPGKRDFFSLLDHEYGDSQVPEVLTGANKYRDTSGQLVNAKKSHSLLLPPEFQSGDVALFSLKRFQGDSEIPSKIDTEIVTPATFDMKVSGVPCRFELVAGIIHSGTLAGGHYWSFTRNQAGCTVFDDSRVSQCPLDRVPGINKAYVLAYRVSRH
jgi:hypothetical protein